MAGTETPHNREEESFCLYTETIMDKKAKRIRVILFYVKFFLGAIVFGAIACFTFVLLYPLLNGFSLAQKEKIVIDLPTDEYPSESDNADTDLQDGTTAVSLPASEKPEMEFSKRIMQMKKMMVTVTPNYVKADDFMEKDHNITGNPGVIIAILDKQLIILSNTQVMEGVENVNVILNDGNQLIANLIQADADTGIAILSAEIGNDVELNQEAVAAAVLDNSYLVEAGTPLYAYGRIMGNSNSVNYGIAVNVENGVSGIDAYYNLIYTNIAKVSGDYAYLFNTDGNVIGILKNDDTHNSMITAYGVSDLKVLIQKLTNRVGITYFGITGQNVTDNISSKYNLPIGVYVSGVYPDSPAFESGIQQGDVITSVSGKTVVTLKAMRDLLYNYNAGDHLVVYAMRRGRDGYKNIEFNVTLGQR